MNNKPELINREVYIFLGISKGKDLGDKDSTLACIIKY